MKQFKVVVVGCGRMATKHISQILRWTPKENIALCDTDVYKARLFSETFGIDTMFHDLEEVFSQFKADVFHIVTPPASHAALAIRCLEYGHVYVEKPFTLTAADAERVIAAAQKHNHQVCVGHQQVFEPHYAGLRAAIAKGNLGKLLHLEGFDSASYLQMEDQGLAHAWALELAGGMYTDLLPHLLSVFTDLADGLAVNHVHVSRNPQGRPAELTVQLSQREGSITAVLRYSFVTTFIRNYVRAEFENGVVLMDIRNRFCVVSHKTALPGVIERVWLNVSQGWQMGWKAVWSVPRFLMGKMDPNQGVANLIDAFYKSLEPLSAPPLSHKSMIEVVDLMRSVVEIGFPEPPAKPRIPHDPQKEALKPKILVTGGTGFIGRHLVRRLLKEGQTVRLVVRRALPPDAFGDAPTDKLQLRLGSMNHRSFLTECLEGIETVYHLAAATRGDLFTNVESTCSATHHLLEALKCKPVKKLVYLSSVAVYDQTQFPAKGEINEAFALEQEPLKRGAYTYAKLRAEEDILNFKAHSSIAVDIIRPGLVWGPGKPQLLLESNVKLSSGLRLVFGKRHRKLPLIYVENLVDAILLSGKKADACSSALNIVDTDLVDQGTYLKQLSEITGNKLSAIFIPLGPLILVAWCGEKVLSLMGKKMSVVYKLKSKSSMSTYSVEKIQKALNWKTRVPFREALIQDVASGT